MSSTTTTESISGIPSEQLVERARKCYLLANETTAEQMEREREDLLFQVAENQWDERARLERKGGIIDGVPTPARPMLSIDQLKHPIQLVFNQFVKSKLGVLLHPVSEKAKKEVAEIKQGLYRRIERDSNATQPRAWALNRAIKAGRGWYRVTTEWDEDGDDPWDQEIRIRRVLYQENVFIDPAAEEPDFSDAKWCLYVAWKDAEDFAREFPDSSITDYASVDWSLFEQNAPGWVRKEDNGKRSVLVAEYWWKDIQTETVKGPNGQKRTKDTVTVYCAKIAGDDVLEEYRWPGRYLPFIPVFGEELIPVDGDRRWQGMIRPARDAQQAFNYGASTLVERASLEPKSPFLADPRQIEGYESWWQQANVRNFPWLPYKATMEGGTLIPPPTRAQLDPTGMSIAQMLIGMSKDFVQSATAVYDPSLGKAESVQESGRKVLALQQQGDASTGQYTTSLAEVSMRYEALVIIDLMPHIYDRPGRVTRILTGEDDEKAVMLGIPFVRNAEGFPVEAQDGQEGAETINLAEGKYSISISVGKSPQTRLEAGQEFLTELISAFPPIMQIAPDLVFQYRDEPGAKEIAERFKREIQATKPYLLDTQEGSVEQAKAQVAALQMQLQQLGQQAQAMDEYIKTKGAEQQAKIQVAQIEAELKLKLAEMDNATKIAVAKIGAAQKATDTQVLADQESLATGLKIEADAATQAREHAHEERMKQQEHAHDAEMGVMNADEPERPNGGAEA